MRVTVVVQHQICVPPAIPPATIKWVTVVVQHQICVPHVYLQPQLSELQQLCCGTCHIASLFLPLPRTATTTSCFSSSLLAAAFTQHFASHPTSAPLLMTSSPLPSPLAVTSHQDQKGLTPLLALALVSIHDAFLTTYALLPSNLSEDSSWILQSSLLHIRSS